MSALNQSSWVPLNMGLRLLDLDDATKHQEETLIPVNASNAVTFYSPPAGPNMTFHMAQLGNNMTFYMAQFGPNMTFYMGTGPHCWIGPHQAVSGREGLEIKGYTQVN